jgi:hypothetical protein
MRKRYYVNVYEYNAEHDTGSNGYIWNAYTDKTSAFNRATELSRTIDKQFTVIVEEHRPIDWPRPHPTL